MKKLIFATVLLLVLATIPAALAETMVSMKPVYPVSYLEANAPATYELTVENNNPFTDNFYVNTLLEIDMSPKSLGVIPSGEKRTFLINVTPGQDIKNQYVGTNFGFEYFVRGDNNALVRDKMIVHISSLQADLDILFPAAINPEDKEVTISLGFKPDLKLGTSVQVTSELMEDDFNIMITNQKKEVQLKLNDLSKKNAGVYNANFDFALGNETIRITKDVVLSPFVNVPTEEVVTGGILSRETRVKKTNDGNSAVKVIISLNRSVVASLFTTFSDTPKTRKEGGLYLYEWDKELNPGQSYEVYLKTNYYVPFLVFLLLLAAVFTFRVVTKSPVEIIKKVAKVRTKSGVFASKIIITVKNTGKPVNNVKIIDRLPAFTEVLPNRFSVVTPSEIKKRTLVWSFPQMATGEEIMFSYIVYSKINVFGRLEIPAAVSTFIDSKDNFRETQSDRIYILSEEEKKPEDVDLAEGM